VDSLAVALLCYPTIGGSGRVATELAAQLAGRGHNVHLISYERPVGLDPAVDFHRVRVIDYPLLRYPPYDQALATAIVELYKRSGVTLFHAHYALPHALAVILADEMLGGERLRLVTTLHGTDITLVGGDPAYRQPLRFGLERSHLVTAVSHSLAADTREILGVDSEIRVIPNFVRCEVETARRPAWRPESGRAVELVHISTFRPVKRVLDLLVSVSVLARHVPVRLTLVGDGPELPECRRFVADSPIADRVEFAGLVEDPSRYLRSADLYLFSSRTESFGLGVLEAMSVGVPVVGPDVGGVREVVGCPPAGRLVPRSQPTALAEAAYELLTAPEHFEAASRLGLERARNEFSPERVLPQYLSAYREALA